MRPMMDDWLDKGTRMEEVGHMKSKLLWDEVSRSDASENRVVSVKLVDTNNGTEENSDIRCRPAFPASTPPVQTCRY